MREREKCKRSDSPGMLRFMVGVLTPELGGAPQVQTQIIYCLAQSHIVIVGESGRLSCSFRQFANEQATRYACVG